MSTRKVADTPLAQWLNAKMGEYADPDTGRRGLSMHGLAQKGGLTQSHIWAILKGDVVPKAEVLTRLAEFFGVSPLTLFRLAYLGPEDQPGFSPEVRAKLLEIEDILAGVPPQARMHLIQLLVTQAQMLKVAAEAWESDTIPGRI